jgi:hypothetical protein
MLCQASTKANCETQNSTKRHEGDKRPTDAEHAVGVSEGKATFSETKGIQKHKAKVM